MTAKDPPQQPNMAAGRIVDPTENVVALVKAEAARLDQLLAMTTAHTERVALLRSTHEAELRRAESERLDAIRAVDVGAVNRAAEVSATVAATLAAQVAASAETLRTQVAATATAGGIALQAALEPIRKDIAELRQVQYEGVGARARGSDNRLNIGAVVGVGSFMLAVIVLIIALSH